MSTLHIGCLLCFVTLCHGFVTVPRMPKLRLTTVKSEPVSHCVTTCHTNLDATRYVLGYVSGTMTYLAISTVNDWLELWLRSNFKK